MSMKKQSSEYVSVIMFKKNTPPLPERANTYINAHALEYAKSTIPGRKMALRRVHKWIELKGASFSDLNEDFLLLFDKFLAEDGLDASSKIITHRYVKDYFIWLHKCDILKIHPQLLFPGFAFEKRKAYNVILPKKVEDFIHLMETQLKPRTLHGYKTNLRSFYFFLKNKNLTLKKLNRTHIEQYMIELKKLKLCEGTRSDRLINLRVYLRWLYENGSFKIDPDHLIRNKDLPKTPEKLPRYLPVEIDRKLQEKLSNSNSIYHWGLLLMRRTGLRIGELSALRFDCVRQNSSSQNFVKVELGKLNTERLVPIDEDTVKLICKIQKKTKEYVKTPQKLTHRPTGKMSTKNDFYDAFKEITLEFKKPIVSHQMRHTYATELLNAGMNLPVIKELLGHKDLKMTAIYAKITLQTVVEEYNKAIKVFQEKYALEKFTSPTDSNNNADLTVMFSEFILRLQNMTKNPEHERSLQLILRRLKRIEKELKPLLTAQ